jgi:LPS-assembly protein
VVLTCLPVSFFQKSFAAKPLQMAPLQLQIGDEINIYANKVFRRDNGQIFEAVGNTVIVHKDETLYGHSASMDLRNKKLEVSGNVRYFSQDINIYGSSMNYDMEQKTLDIGNARLYTAFYSIVARKIEKVSKNYYIAEEAEFTTCKDCPESWTIYGARVDYTVNEYVHVKHALLRVNGADLMYFPYIIFPVIKDRQSGVLFPKISTEDSGWNLGIPLYWAINQESDLTFTPYYRTRRGGGAEFEYRHALNNYSSIEYSTRWYNDEIYRPGKLNEKKAFSPSVRNFSDLEFHYRMNQDHGVHFRFVDMKDFDFVRDEYRYTNERMYSNDIGIDFVYNGRSDRFEWNFETYERKNILNADPVAYSNQFKRDQDNVQVLPKVSLGMSPIQLLRGDRNILPRALFGLDMDATVFQQHKKQELFSYTSNSTTVNRKILRNTLRNNVHSYVSVDWFDDGRFKLNSQYDFKYQHYDFRDDQEDQFQKYSGVLRTELSFGVDKIYGLSYREKIPKQNNLDTYDENNGLYIGHLRDFSLKNIDPHVEVIRNSYKHGMDFKLIHQVIPSEREFGNKNFLSQIKDPDIGAKAWFDQNDAIQSRVTELGSAELKKGDSSNNIFEFHWENSLVRKAPQHFNYNDNKKYLKDNFNYETIAHFNIKQGVRLESNENVKDKSQKFTKLGVNLGVYAYKYIQFYATDYYNYDNKKHNIEINMSNDFNFVRFSNGLKYLEDDGDTVKKIHSFGVGFQLTDEYYFSFNRSRDLGQNENINQKIAFVYTPYSKCWAIGSTIVKNSDDTRLSFDFELNFGTEIFPRNMVKEI